MSSQFKFESGGFVAVPASNGERNYYDNAIAVKLSPKAKMPYRANPTDAGADLHALVDLTTVINPGETKLIDTGVAVQIPRQFVGFVFNRSGQGSKGIILLNSVGVIDADYRGTIKVALMNLSHVPYEINPGDRIAQLVVQKVELVQFVDIWNNTERGTQGFGSTGK